MWELEKNETWDVMELPKGKRSVGCELIFNVKYIADDIKFALLQKNVRRPMVLTTWKIHTPW